MNAGQLIAFLNAVNVGDLSRIRDKLSEARQACLELEQSALAEHLQEAAHALERADVKTYRRRLETVIARLGHLR